VAAQGAILERIGEDSGLQEPGIGQQPEERQSLADIVQVVKEELFRISAEGLADPVAVEIDPLAGSDAEVAGNLFQSVALQAAQADIVELHQKIGIDDMTAIHIPAGVVDNLFGQAPAGAGSDVRNGAVAAPLQADTVHLGAPADVVQVETEDVMADDHIRVTAVNGFVQSPQKFRLGQEVTAQHGLIAVGVLECDGDDAVFRAFRVGKLVPFGAKRFNIQGQAVDSAEIQTFEQGCSG